MKKRRILSAIAAVLLLLPCVIFAGCGKKSAKLPEKTDAFYCCDTADVLDPTAENRISTLNDALFALTGAQIVVVTVETTEKTDIGRYAATLFQKWGIGSVERNNGVLLLLAVGDENYYTLRGEGLTDVLSDEMLRSLFNEHLEPDFAKKQYSTGVLLWLEALVSRLEAHYGVSLETWDGAPGTFTSLSDNGGSSVLSDGISPALVIIFAIAAVIVILIIILIIGAGRGRKRRRRRTPPIASRPVYRPGYYPNTRPAVRPPNRQNPNNSGRK